MISAPAYFSVFVDPVAGSGVLGNPVVICEASDLSSTDSLVDAAKIHPGMDVCFYHRIGDHVQVRWFNGQHEIQFCGHAALALAWWLHSKRVKVAHFESSIHSYEPLVLRGRIWIKLPVLKPDSLTGGSFDIDSLGIDSVSAFFEPSTKTLLVECPYASTVEAWQPDFDRLLKLPKDSIGALIIFSRAGAHYDGYLRYFSPWYGKNEDSATGSAMRLLFPLIEKPDSPNSERYLIRQLSERGGILQLRRFDEDSLLLSGAVVESA